MPDEITFIDLACLLRITPDTTLEKFGSAINASIFDASNLAGTLKQKSLIDFSSYYPGPNTIVITDVGKALITEANAKSSEPFDNLDQEILSQVAGGKKVPAELQNALNLRPKDLALRLYKLFKQGLMIYDLKSGGAVLMLTETGFLKTKAASAQVAAPIQPQAPKPEVKSQTPQPTVQPQVVHQQSTQPVDDQQPHEMPKYPKPSSDMKYYIVMAIILILIVALLYYLHVI